MCSEKATQPLGHPTPLFGPLAGNAAMSRRKSLHDQKLSATPGAILAFRKAAFSDGPLANRIDMLAAVTRMRLQPSRIVGAIETQIPALAKSLEKPERVNKAVLACLDIALYLALPHAREKHIGSKSRNGSAGDSFSTKFKVVWKAFDVLAAEISRVGSGLPPEVAESSAKIRSELEAMVVSYYRVSAPNHKRVTDRAMKSFRSVDRKIVAGILKEFVTLGLINKDDTKRWYGRLAERARMACASTRSDPQRRRRMPSNELHHAHT